MIRSLRFLPLLFVPDVRPDSTGRRSAGGKMGNATPKAEAVTRGARMLRTAWTDEWENPEGPGPLPMPMQPILIGPALQRLARVADTEGSGGQKLVTYFVGQVVGAMNTVKPTRRVVLEMVEEFIDAVDRLDTLTHTD